MSVEKGIQRVIRNILKDIRIDLGDEFDKNFERQAFFSEQWVTSKKSATPWTRHFGRYGVNCARAYAAEAQTRAFVFSVICPTLAFIMKVVKSR